MAAHLGVWVPLCPPPSRFCHLEWLQWILTLSPTPAMLDLPGRLPVRAAGTGPSGLQVQEASAGHSNSSPSPIPPWDSDAPRAARGAAGDPQHCWAARPLCCVPQGQGPAGAVPAGVQGAAAGQPPQHIPPHQPDAGQCWEEIQALSGSQLQPLLWPLA